MENTIWYNAAEKHFEEQATANECQKNMQHDSFVRKNSSISQQLVQSGH